MVCDVKQSKNRALSGISSSVLQNPEVPPEKKRSFIIQVLGCELLTNNGLLSRDRSLEQRLTDAVQKNIPYLRDFDCADQRVRGALVRVEPLLQETVLSFSEALDLGWLYQKLRESDRENLTSAIPSASNERPKESEEIALLTQTFTDDYIVRFLLEKAVQEIRFDTAVTICDPACGTGHFLIEAFRKTGKLERIFGFDIDAEGVELAKLLLLIESKPEPVDLAGQIGILDSNLQAFNHKFGTLKRLPDQRLYDIVVTNPPYIARRKMHPDLLAFLDLNYPATSQDLCSAFIQRSLELCKPGGVVALLTMNRWLTLDTYDTVRNGGTGFAGVLSGYTLRNLVDLGSKALAPRQALHDSVRLVMTVLQNKKPEGGSQFDYLDLSTEPNHALKAITLALKPAKKISQVVLRSGAAQEVLKIGDAVWLSKLPRVEDVAEVVVGIQTNDDAQFVKYFWEVAREHPGWIPHHKGGGNGRWSGQAYWVLDMRDGGKRYLDSKKNSARQLKEHIERPGWCYSWLANGVVGLRERQAGSSIGRAAGSGVYFEDLRIAAVMNSRMFSFFANKFSSKAQLPEGVFRSLPLPRSLEGISSEHVREAIDTKRLLAAQKLNEPTHALNTLVSYEELKTKEARLRELETDFNRQVLQAYELPDVLRVEYETYEARFPGYVTSEMEYAENILSALVLDFLGGAWFTENDLRLNISGASLSRELLINLPADLALHLPDIEKLGNSWLRDKFFKRHSKEFFGKPVIVVEGLEMRKSGGDRDNLGLVA